MNYEQLDIEFQQSVVDVVVIVGVNDEVECLCVEVEQVKVDVLCECVDLENQCKCVVCDIEQVCKFVNEKLLGELLLVFDSLDVGLKVVGDDLYLLCEGLELIYKQLFKVVVDNGLVLFDLIGQLFNLEYYQVISQVLILGVVLGSVVIVFQKGYLFNECLLWLVLVVVVVD